MIFHVSSPPGRFPCTRRPSRRSDRGPRASTVRREPGVRFDLDGVAKGWLADRAIAITPGRSALVDALGADGRDVYAMARLVPPPRAATNPPS